MRNILSNLTCLKPKLDENGVDSSKALRLEPIGASKHVERFDWMKKMRSRRLRNICLPGTHQSTNFKSGSGRLDAWCRCQRLSVLEQLNIGVRFLDSPLKCDDTGEVYCSSYGSPNLPLKDLLRTVRDFTKINRSEIVGLNLFGDLRFKDWTSVSHLIQTVLKNRIIPEHMVDMAIGDILDQGLNIFLCGLPVEIFKQTWRLFDHLPKIESPHLNGPQEIRKNLDEIQEGGANKMALVWMHAEANPNDDLQSTKFETAEGRKFASLEQISSCINYELLDHFKRTDKCSINILTMDFVHDHVIAEILLSNEFSDRGLLGIFLSPPVLNRSQLLNSSGERNRSPERLSGKRLTSGSSVFNNSAINSSFDFGHKAFAPIRFKESNM